MLIKRVFWVIVLAAGVLPEFAQAAKNAPWVDRYRGRMSPKELRGLDSALEAEVELFVNQVRKRGIKYDKQYRRLLPTDGISIAVTDLDTGEDLVTINTNTSRMAASLIKLHVMLLYYDRVEAGAIKATAAHKETLRRMIRNSCNTSTNKMLRLLGGPEAANSLLRAQFPVFEHTRIVEYIPAGGRTYKNLTSTHDLNVFMSLLWQGRLPGSNEMLDILALKNNDRFVSRTKIPQSAQVYDKTGSVFGLCGDSGIVKYRDPRTGKTMSYAISMMIEDETKTNRRSRNMSYGAWIGFRGYVMRRVSESVFGFLHHEKFGYELASCPDPSR